MYTYRIKQEQSVFCFKLGKSTTICLEGIKNSFENEAINPSKIFESYKQFVKSHEATSDDFRACQLSTPKM